MKQLFSILCFLTVTQSFAATETSAIQKTFTQAENNSKSDLTAVVSTNFVDLGKNSPNINIDVMMNSKTAASFSYSNSSDRVTRNDLAGKPKLSLDRSRFGIGADFYFKPLSSVYNFALLPSLIFQNEKDAFDSEATTGIGLRAIGSFKPFPRLMAQGGVATTVMGSETTTDLLVGMGLLF